MREFAYWGLIGFFSGLSVSFVAGAIILMSATKKYKQADTLFSRAVHEYDRAKKMREDAIIDRINKF